MLMMVGLMFSASSAFAGDKTITGTVVANSPYVQNTSSTIDFNVSWSSIDFEYMNTVIMTVPAGFTIEAASTMVGSRYTASPVISGQVITWGTDPNSGWNPIGTNSGNIDFTITVNGNLTGNQAFAFNVLGDIWGGLPHSFTGNAMVEQAVPKLAINPEVLDLGEWPIDGWQEMAYLELSNGGTGSVTVNASELDDVDAVFALTNPNLPLVLTEGGPSTMVGVSFTGNGVAAGPYSATYVASWGAAKSVTTAEIIVGAYTAVEGDIVENPYMATLPVAEVGMSTGMPMRGNYVIRTVYYRGLGL